VDAARLSTTAAPGVLGPAGVSTGTEVKDRGAMDAAAAAVAAEDAGNRDGDANGAGVATPVTPTDTMDAERPLE
jgi:hypothetical protein